MFSTFLVRRLRASSIYKILFIGLASSMIPLGLLFGVFALLGADTIRWNNEPIHGVSGLLAGPLIGIAMAIFFSVFFGTACALGLWAYSKFRPLFLSAKNLEQYSGGTTQP